MHKLPSLCISSVTMRRGVLALGGGRVGALSDVFSEARAMRRSVLPPPRRPRPWPPAAPRRAARRLAGADVPVPLCARPGAIVRRFWCWMTWTISSLGTLPRAPLRSAPSFPARRPRTRRWCAPTHMTRFTDSSLRVRFTKSSPRLELTRGAAGRRCCRACTRSCGSRSRRLAAQQRQSRCS